MPGLYRNLKTRAVAYCIVLAGDRALPELPEVETVVRGLRGSLVGRRIVGVRFGKTDFIEDPVALGEQLPGSRIARVERYGKFVTMALEPLSDTRAPFHLFIHLGMTGQLMPRKPYEPVAAHTHAFVELDDGFELRYTDIRRFGQILLMPEERIGGFRQNLGSDPLEISEKNFIAEIRARSARIKALLLDQSVLRGMGNIYTDESLWRARIHPARRGANLQPRELSKLHRAIRQILSNAIRLHGSTISDYLDAEGFPGEYQSRHRVYGRKGKPCPRCKSSIRRVIVAGRSSYFCPKCQSAPRTLAHR
jgi:formamidopyrimidine-DNA glycosylase